ncbi:MAG: hydroxyphenylacetyl-CoA thioesterase PaaI [Sphingobium sp.]|jgi:acyl-CoA thioesterase|nr:hydroxyphenylacetyl-CoA thioesterase PaaI [Sphingobium sp.]MCI1271710.1 hydroxyphenylacetyl-CoA thioesterase PaaI [Sphingobium sp.]MCI1756111.1 hydroxyphenylacetyl-CoA thioesterase PaaI [Sphingobium sp.]MCI2053566.1 hydroxyphenylacetyl-CoA thioesterase PaaI [Sphingobium sp.]
MSVSEEDRLARRIAEHMLAKEGTGNAWGLVIEDGAAGYSRLRMTIRQDMTNAHGTAHGGMIFALADTAFAYACNSRNQATVAAGASIIFLAPAQEGDILIAEAREESISGRSGAYSVAVRTSDGRVVAHFQGQSRAIGGTILETRTEETHNG